MNTTKQFRFAVGLVAVITLTVSACDSLLDVETPYTIAANSIDPVEDAATFSNSAWQNFAVSLGDAALYEGWFTNELRVGDTFPTRNEYGRRFLDDRNSTMAGLWDNLSRAVASSEDAIVDLGELEDSNINVTRLYLAAGFSALTMADGWCTGVIRAGGPEAPTPELTKAQMLDHAIMRFEQAVASGTANGTADGIAMANAARVGLARANLFAGNNGAVASAVSGVPADFEYTAVYIDDASSRGRLGNGVYAFSGSTASRESGVVGPEWRALGQGEDVSAAAPYAAEMPGDARVSWKYDGRTAQDGVHGFVFQTSMPGWDAPIMVASGLEARYLVEQAGGTDASRMALINERRSANGLDPFAGGDSDTILEELLHQKGRDFWLMGRRMADWRWYTGDGSINRTAHFRFIIEPTDQYYKPEVGGMGDDICFPLPYREYSRNPDINR
jgi:hypothetical protein